MHDDEIIPKNRLCICKLDDTWMKNDKTKPNWHICNINDISKWG